MNDGACPECGAVPPAGRTCQTLLHDLLERKYSTDAAEYGLAMACYTLQHPAQQRDEALAWALFHLTLAVQHGSPLEEVRRAARVRFDRRRHRPAAAPLRAALQRTTWRMTIAQLEAGAAGRDAERILRWARTILDDLRDARPDPPGDPPTGE